MRLATLSSWFSMQISHLMKNYKECYKTSRRFKKRWIWRGNRYIGHHWGLD